MEDATDCPPGEDGVGGATTAALLPPPKKDPDPRIDDPAVLVVGDAGRGGAAEEEAIVKIPLSVVGSPPPCPDHLVTNFLIKSSSFLATAELIPPLELNMPAILLLLY